LIFLRAEIHEEVMIMAKKPLYKSLYFQVIVAIIAGVLIGHFFPSGTQLVNGVEKHVPGLGEQLKPLGDGFIRLIKMIIAPVIFCTVVSGIAGMESMKSVGKTGGIALLYFEIVSTIALLVGLLVLLKVKFFKSYCSLFCSVLRCISWVMRVNLY